MTTKTELKTHIKRLKHLAVVLAQVPKDLWDMGDFGEGDPKCKTACCVLGHAAFTPEFKKQGLKWTRRADGTFRIKYEDETYDGAGAKFFGLSKVQSDTLFMGGMNMTRGEKVEQVLELVEDKERELASL